MRTAVFVPGILLSLSAGGCGGGSPFADAAVHELPPPPAGPMLLSIEGTTGSWKAVFHDLASGTATEALTIRARRVDGMFLSVDRTKAVIHTSESANEREFKDQRIWLLDLSARRAHESVRTGEFIYTSGTLGGPWIASSSFTEEYSGARRVIGKVFGGECRAGVATISRWRDGRWEAEATRKATCSENLGPVVTMATEMPPELSPVAETLEPRHALPDGPIDRVLRAAKPGPWEVWLDRESIGLAVLIGPAYGKEPAMGGSPYTAPIFEMEEIRDLYPVLAGERLGKPVRVIGDVVKVERSGRWLLVGTSNRLAKVFDLESGELVLERSDAAVARLWAAPPLER